MSYVVYSHRYNIGFYGLERLHPFDSRKYGRAWRSLKSHFGADLKLFHIRLDRSANEDELLLVHTADYLQQLRNSRYVAKILELPQVGLLPYWLIDSHVLDPMRWATRGTIVAAESALKNGFAINLSGGYHHAKPDCGEGFSVYADAAIAVSSLRDNRLLNEKDRVVFIDTDAHQGNGNCHSFMTDDRIFIFDIFNSRIYPFHDKESRGRIDCEIALTQLNTGTDYNSKLKKQLPKFLDSVCDSNVGLAIYNAGTDVFSGDPLGGLDVSQDAILERDLFVAAELRKRKIPFIMLPSGGYTKQSYQLLANSVIKIIESRDTNDG